MSRVEFDFARYVAHRRGMAEKRARDGAAYAYAGDRKVRRALASARPVSLAIEATTRLWKNAARNQLLGTSVKVTNQQFPRAWLALRRGCEALQLKPPPLYATPATMSLTAQALGTDDDPYIAINSSLVERLDDVELLALLGSRLGQVQNNHVVYNTALYYLTTAAAMFVRWIVQPAIMALQSWSRRAEITCDRAALLCTRNLEATLTTLVKLALGTDEAINIREYLSDLPETARGIGKYAELFRSHPYLPKRVQAVQLFANSSFYLAVTAGSGAGGLATDEVDARVAQILKVF